MLIPSFYSIANRLVQERYTGNVVRRDMLGSFVNRGLRPEQAVSEIVLQM